MKAASRTNFKQPASGAYVDLDELLALRFAARELTLTPRQLSQSQLAGGVRTRFRGRGMEFEEVRHYQPGDDIRSIDWRVTARTQVTHTKLFREERERPVIVMLDQRSSMFFGSQHCFKSVAAANVAALMSWTALANNDRIGALIFNDLEERDIRPKRSRHTLLNILQETQRFNRGLTSPVAPDNQVSLTQRLSDLRRIAKPGSAVIIISDFRGLDGSSDEQLYQLARHTDVSLLHISDPLEAQLPDKLRLTITNGRQRRTLDTANRSIRDHYQREFGNHLQHVQTLAAQMALPLLNISTAQSPLLQLQTLFGKHSCQR
ncbi:MAG: DUF58 domain-containing protein [Cellvibrionaceae bacterium]|nr:DUF58 domain-containing protein [Cellvibrionaceae bacterium]